MGVVSNERLEQRSNGRIEQTAGNELLLGDSTVLNVAIEPGKYLSRHMGDVSAGQTAQLVHLPYGEFELAEFHDVVLIGVVELKGEVQFALVVAARRERVGNEELAEGQVARLVEIERVEDAVGDEIQPLRFAAMQKLVEAMEAVAIEPPVRIVDHELFVPAKDLLGGQVEGEGQVLNLVRRQIGFRHSLTHL